jgi:cytochrome c
VWDEKNLDSFIANPEALILGNAMKPYGGIASEEERQKIIGYLKSTGGN